MPSTVEINANRDFGGTVKLFQFDPTTGARTPRTTGSPTVFVSATDDAAAAILGGLSVPLTHIGNGVWTFAFDGAALTDAILSGLPSGTGFLIVKLTGDEWSKVPLLYVPTKLAKIQ